MTDDHIPPAERAGVRRDTPTARRWGARVLFCVALVVATEFVVAAVLANLEPFNTPGGPALLRSPRLWIESVAPGRVTYTRPSGLERSDWGGPDEQSLVAERFSGWPFQCFVYRVVDRGRLEIEGGFAIVSGELVLGPPTEYWRFPKLGRYVVPFRAAPLPLLGCVAVLGSACLGTLMIVKGVRCAWRQQVRRRRVAGGRCERCGYPQGPHESPCPECGATDSAMTDVGNRAERRSRPLCEQDWKKLVGFGLSLVVAGALVYFWSPRRDTVAQSSAGGISAISPPPAPSSGLQNPPLMSAIAIDVMGFRIGDDERAYFRFRIEAPVANEVVVARKSLEDWVGGFVAMPESTAVLQTRMDQRLSSPDSVDNPAYIQVPSAESREFEIEVLASSVKLVKPGTLYLYLPPARITYEIPSKRQTRVISCEELKQFDLR